MLFENQSPVARDLPAALPRKTHPRPAANRPAAANRVLAAVPRQAYQRMLTGLAPVALAYLPHRQEPAGFYAERLTQNFSAGRKTPNPIPETTTRRPLGAGASLTVGSGCLLLVFTDLVADQAADRRTADGAEGAAARKHGTSNGPDSSAYRGILITRRHVAATAHTEQHRCRNCTDCKPMHRFHGDSSFSNYSYKTLHASQTNAYD